MLPWRDLTAAVVLAIAAARRSRDSHTVLAASDGHKLLCVLKHPNG